jgi:hypothetical protein
MLRRLNLLFCLIAALLWEEARAETALTQIDLRLFPFGTGNYEFHEAWDFYPAELLTPDEIQTRSPPRKLSMIAIIPDEHQLGELRHGTFRMQIRLPEPAWHYTIFFPELRSASRIWINGKQISNPGRVGTSLADEKPAMRPVTHTLQDDTRELDIVLQLSAYSNYQFMSSSTPIAIGLTPYITAKHTSAKIRDAFVVGAIFIISASMPCAASGSIPFSLECSVFGSGSGPSVVRRDFSFTKSFLSRIFTGPIVSSTGASASHPSPAAISSMSCSTEASTAGL